MLLFRRHFVCLQHTHVGNAGVGSDMPWASSGSIFTMLNDQSTPKPLFVQHQSQVKDKLHKRAKVHASLQTCAPIHRFTLAAVWLTYCHCDYHSRLQEKKDKKHKRQKHSPEPEAAPSGARTEREFRNIWTLYGLMQPEHQCNDLSVQLRL